MFWTKFKDFEAVFLKPIETQIADWEFWVILVSYRAVAAYEANEAEASLDFQTFFSGPPNFLGATKIFRGHQNILGLVEAWFEIYFIGWFNLFMINDSWTVLGSFKYFFLGSVNIC